MWIILFCPNYSSDSPAGIGNIARIPWDEMQMGMHHRLAGSFPAVHPDVVSRRRVHSVQMLFHKPNQFTYGRMLFRGEIEPRGDMPAWDDQDMTWRDRVQIPFYIGEFIPE